MLRTRTLIVLIMILAILLAALIYFYYFYFRTPAEKARQEGMTHLFSIYGWGTKKDELLVKPRGVASDENGNIYVTVPSRGLIAVFDREGNFLYKFGGWGMNPGNLRGGIGIAVSSKHNRVYVADRVRFRLVIYTLKGQFIKEVPILSPVTPYVAPDGRVFLATFGPIVIFDKDGNQIRSFGRRGLLPGEFDYPHGLAMDKKGYLYVSDTNNTRLQVLDKKFKVVGVKGQPPRSLLETVREFGLPAGMAIDEKDRLWVVDSFDFSIKVYTNTGKFLAKFGGESGSLEGQFKYPDGIAYLGNRTFAIADTGNNRVQVIRFTLPGEARIPKRIPWWLWLLLVPLLLWLASQFGKKKYFADEEFLVKVFENGKLALLASVTGRVFVLPGIFEKYFEYEEEGLRADEVLFARDFSENLLNDMKEKFNLDDSEAGFLAMANKRWYEKVLFHRFTLLTENERAKEAAEKMGLKTMTYSEFIETYEEESEN